MDDAVCCGGQGAIPKPPPVPGFVSRDLGDVQEGTLVAYDFSVENHSKDTVVLQKETVCNYPGRATADLEGTDLKPGQKTDLHVEFQTRGKPGPFDIFVRIVPKSGSILENYHLSGYVLSKKAPNHPEASSP